MVAKLEADAKRAAAAKAKREKELRRRKPPSPDAQRPHRSRRQRRQSCDRRRQVAATRRRQVSPKAAPVGRADAQAGIAERPKLHDLPLDGRAPRGRLSKPFRQCNKENRHLSTCSSLPCPWRARSPPLVVGFELCGNQPERRVVVRNRHRHAIEHASRRSWRRHDDSARTRRKILISTQASRAAVALSPARRTTPSASGSRRRALHCARGEPHARGGH